MKNILTKSLFVSVAIILTTSSASALNYCTDLTKTLSKGSQNSQVLKLQQYLFEGGYLVAKPNGYFGAGTVKAVKSFQYEHQLSETGSLGSATRKKIKDVSCGNGVVDISKEDKVLVSQFNSIYNNDYYQNLTSYYYYSSKYEYGQPIKKDQYSKLLNDSMGSTVSGTYTNPYSTSERIKMLNDALDLTNLFINNIDTNNTYYIKASKAVNDLKQIASSMKNEQVKTSALGLISSSEKELKAKHDLIATWKEKENFSKDFLQKVIKTINNNNGDISSIYNLPSDPISDQKMKTIDSDLENFANLSGQTQSDSFKAYDDYKKILGLE